MSYAEDNGYYEPPECLEVLWGQGLHRTSSGELMDIYKMTDEHLDNTIRYFRIRDYDISSLLAEKKKRNNKLI